MKKALSLLALATLAAAPGNSNNAPGNRKVKKTRGPKLQNCYGVSFRKDATVETKENAKNFAGGRRDREWSTGFQVCGTSETRVQQILDNLGEEIEEVFEDAIVYKTGPTSLWGLDRIDSPSASKDGDYVSPGNQGEGTTVYVLDTCGDVSHNDFGGRAEYISAADQYPGDAFTASCCDHGTHCMGTVGGNTYGVAKKVNLKSIRVLGCDGRGSYTGILSAMDWVRLNHDVSTDGRAIVSMSLGGGGTYSPMQTAVDNLRASGILTTVAAGNEATDACGTSPAFVPSAITVGASTDSMTLAGFSNYGSCVDINAPGAYICSTYPGQASTCWDGTSMATPHVAGALAVLFSNDPTLSPDAAEALLLSEATSSIPNSRPGHTEKFLNVANFGIACVVDGCSSCPSDPTCDACRDGYALSGGSCTPCSVSDCRLCASDAGTCTACAGDRSLVNNQCIQCPANCASCSAADSCDTCEAGYATNSQGDCILVCESRATSALDSIVDSINFAGQSFSHSDCSVYQKISMNPTVTPGQTYSMTVGQGTCSGDYYKTSAAWIDWNGDGTFAASEQVLTGQYAQSRRTPTSSVTVPVDAVSGTVNARVVVVESSSIGQCGTYTYGETVDFVVTVESLAPECTVSDDCTPSDACQTATCTASGECVETATDGCCVSTDQCLQNADTCTATSCQNNQCVDVAIDNCCESHAECPVSTTPCLEATCGANNRCSLTAVCDCCETSADCDDGDANTVDECSLFSGDVEGQCYHTPVNCDTQLDGTCWFQAAADQSCSAKCVAEGRQVSTKTGTYAGSGDAECLAVARLFNPTATFSRTSAHGRGCVLTNTGNVVRGTKSTLLNSACETEQRFCACDSVSAATGQTLELVAGGFALLLGGLVGGMLLQQKRKQGSTTSAIDRMGMPDLENDQPQDDLAVSIHTTEPRQN